jgi:hypothetical protein
MQWRQNDSLLLGNSQAWRQVSSHWDSTHFWAKIVWGLMLAHVWDASVFALKSRCDTSHKFVWCLVHKM